MAAYIKFTGPDIEGEAKDKDHEKWSDLVSVNQGLHQPGGGKTGSTRRRGDVILDDIVIIKEMDKASPKIAESVCKGTDFDKVEIHLTASISDKGRETYYSYELKNVLVTNYNLGGVGQSEEVPTEDISLNFDEIKVTYYEFKTDGTPKGKVEYGWKAEKGEVC